MPPRSIQCRGNEKAIGSGNAPRHNFWIYLMYIDESGDTGLVGSPTKFFGLSGIVVHESRWRDFINVLIAFRRTMKSVYGLPIRTEIHASHYVNHKPVDLPRHTRLAVLRNALDEIAKLDYISITNVIVRKDGKPDDYNVFDSAWSTLFQRFENTLGSRLIKSTIPARRSGRQPPGSFAPA
ncbi:MAG: DUF3800 domain-containing protein, partial [Xanthobacteraceae bacterium]|nr:DUF3800 domain-containing protein [Xanthobacteraceae bacterium]